MIRKIIDIIWILANICIIYASGASAYHTFIIGDTSRAILQTVVIIGFIILTVFIIIKDVVPDFKERKGGAEND